MPPVDIKPLSQLVTGISPKISPAFSPSDGRGTEVSRVRTSRTDGDGRVAEGAGDPQHVRAQRDEPSEEERRVDLAHIVVERLAHQRHDVVEHHVEEQDASGSRGFHPA
eukprot:1848381-Pyramimonas_sp.AAC.1